MLDPELQHPCGPALLCELPPACFVAGASGLAGRSGGISAWSCLAAGGCPPVSGLLLLAGGPATAVCVGCGVVGVGSVLLGVGIGASGGWVGLLAEGVWFGSRGGSAEATGAGRGGGEAVGGAGLWGWRGVVLGLVGTAGAASRGKSVGVSSIPSDDRRLFSAFSGLVVSARFARVGFAIADCTSWRANLSSFAPERRLDLRVEATATVGTTPTVPTSRDALFSPAEVIARCHGC